MTGLTKAYVSRTILDQDLVDSIIHAVPQVIIQNQVAHFCGIHKQNLHQWLNRGYDEAKEGKETIFSQLAQRYHTTRAEVVRNIIFELKQCPKNYQALTWILEKCFREDFGSESEEIRELRAMFLQILPLMGGKITGDKGYVEVKELDSKGNQEAGRITS